MQRCRCFIRNVMGITFGIFASLVIMVSVRAADDEALQFSKDSGYYSQSFDLTISAQPGYTIYYTTDGSKPQPGDASTKQYTGPIRVANQKNTEPVLTRSEYAKQFVVSDGWNGAYVPSKSNLDRASIIRAAGVDASGAMTLVSTRTYFIGNNIKEAYNGCAVMSIVTDPDNLLDGKTGIYVLGDAYNSLYYPGDKELEEYANFMQHGQEWERSSYMEFFNGEDTADVSLGVGIRIHGGYSRRNQQKSINVYFREDYDYGTKNLKGYELIPDSGKNKYKNVMLRNGGNDADITKFQDVFIQSMVTDKNFTTQAARPCMLYLNGEYWGLYNLTEKYSDKYLEEQFDVNNKNVIVYKDMEIDEGEDLDPDGNALKELLALGNLDMTKEENYKKFQDMVDIDSYIDYYATEVYICNNDWWSGTNDETPNNNIEFWKVADPSQEDASNPYADGKWRYMLFDTEWSMGIYNSNEAGAYYDSIKYHAMGEDNGKGDPVFKALMKNSDFRMRFTNALLDVRNWNFEYNRASAALDKMTAIYTPLMEKNRIRWNTGNVSGGVNNMRNFLKNRPGYIFTMLENNMQELKNNERSEVNLWDNIGSSDCIKINTIVPDISKSWNGEYYRAYPITVKANAVSGYDFDHWEITGAKAEDENAQEKKVTLNDAKVSIQAIYKDAEGDIPVPSATPTPTPKPVPSPTPAQGGGNWPWGGGNTPGDSTPAPSDKPQPTATADVSPTPTAEPPKANDLDNKTPVDTSNAGVQSPGGNMAQYEAGYKFTYNGGIYIVTAEDSVSLIGVENKNITSFEIEASITVSGKVFNVTKIGNSAFAKCKKLKRIVIGSNIEIIGKKAFKGCAKLKSITIKSVKLSKAGKKSFAGINKKAKIKVPKKKLKAYKKLLKNKGQKKTVKIKK